MNKKFSDPEYGQEHILKLAIPLAAIQNVHKMESAFLTITAQFVYCSKKAQINIDNVLPGGTMLEGTIVFCLEKPGDWGKLAQASKNYTTVISNNPKTEKTQVKLPSSSKKVTSLATSADVR
ncbi:60S Ribosomal Protein L8 [Manis pentadactyla]|nr:60S Ribosomal Protein L8 [Manis pentadactyla]